MLADINLVDPEYSDVLKTLNHNQESLKANDKLYNKTIWI